MPTASLKFSPMGKNAKLRELIKTFWIPAKAGFTFSLPSGHSCPHAKDCLSKADRKTGKITDGKSTQFRCFSASQEALFTNVREQRWHNYEVLKKADKQDGFFQAILSSLPAYARLVRVHVAGDFFNQTYFDAWMAVADVRPECRFYAYTKALPYWIKRLDQIPPNFVLTASVGGRRDDLIAANGLRFAKVVYSEEQAQKEGLPLDHDDSHAAVPGGPFALLIHGIQPANSIAGKSVALLNGKGSYGKMTSGRKGGKV